MAKMPFFKKFCTILAIRFTTRQTKKSNYGFQTDSGVDQNGQQKQYW
jgi:hypothetical protein